MAPERHRRERGVDKARDAVPTPLSLSGGDRRMAGTLMAIGTKLRAPGLAEIDVPGGVIVRQRAGATEVEGKGDVCVRAAAFLEGVEPYVEVVDAEVAAAEVIRDDIALSPLVPLSGVVGTVNARGAEVEELTERYRHARAAFSVLMEC